MLLEEMGENKKTSSNIVEKMPLDNLKFILFDKYSNNYQEYSNCRNVPD